MLFRTTVDGFTTLICYYNKVMVTLITIPMTVFCEIVIVNVVKFSLSWLHVKRQGFVNKRRETDKRQLVNVNEASNSGFSTVDTTRCFSAIFLSAVARSE